MIFVRYLGPAVAVASFLAILAVLLFGGPPA